MGLRELLFFTVSPVVLLTSSISVYDNSGKIKKKKELGTLFKHYSDYFVL